MRRGVLYMALSAFGFSVMMRGRAVNTWRYRITPTATGCDVTESFELDNNPFTRIYWLVAGRWRGKTNVDGMRQTLERIKAVVDA